MMGWRIAMPLAMGLTSPNVADAAGSGASMAIRYADLDLSQERDALRLHARVRNAIRTICAQPRQGVLASPAESLCRRTAMVRAQGQIDRAVTLAAAARSVGQGRFATVVAR